MFSFHKPKIYRSNLGCCICKAKSSSSRFTDSQKYENEFERCFRIQEKRSGEICNACVLLVKRWKKLSPENRLTKHWHHVVDARAGPGTKLSGNRRILSHQPHQSASSSSSSTSSRAHHKSSASSTSTTAAAAASCSGNRSDVLPLSSSQANQQTSSSGSSGGGASGKGRASSSLSKARAIDTNVSTFTFGEPPASAYRRNYMTGESASYSAFSSLAPLNSHQGHSFSSGPTKPQSALNSSAFESVIKRFRQRQQQQHLEQQRRQMSRLQRQMERQQRRQQSASAAHGKSAPATATAATPTPTTTTTTTTTTQSDLSGNANDIDHEDQPVSSHDNDSQQETNQTGGVPPPPPTQSKRVKRLSESYGSLASLESLKVASVLDASIWRREKICCGIIFRGLFNEVAIFPKLLKPCECRSQGPPTTGQPEGEAIDDKQRPGDDEEKETLSESSPPPPSRAVKSGSISSSTSGTGSMEQAVEEVQTKATAEPTRLTAAAAAVGKRPRSVPSKRRRQQRKTELDVSGSSELSYQSSKESTSADSPGSGTSSSGGSSSRMILMIDGEQELDEDQDELVLAANDALESSNDASSSAESLLEMEDKNSSALAMG